MRRPKAVCCDLVFECLDMGLAEAAQLVFAWVESPCAPEIRSRLGGGREVVLEAGLEAFESRQRTEVDERREIVAGYNRKLERAPIVPEGHVLEV